MKQPNSILYIIILILSLALFATKIIAIQRVERIWKCEKYLSPFGQYTKYREESGIKIYVQPEFTEEQKCYFNF